MTKFQRIKFKAQHYNSNIVNGLQLFIEAHFFVLKNKLRIHLLISGLFFLALFSFSLSILIDWIDSVEATAIAWIIKNFKAYVNLEIAQIQKFLEGVFWLLKWSIESNQDSIFTSVFLIIGTPFFSFISGKVDEIISKKNRPFTFVKWIKEIVRGIKISSLNTLKQFFFFVLITLFSFIPVAGIIAPLLTFIVQAYYNGILMTDYSLESRGYTVKESRQFYKSEKAMMFSIGLGFMFLLLIPVIGWFLAPTYALVASALFFTKK